MGDVVWASRGTAEFSSAAAAAAAATPHTGHGWNKERLVCEDRKKKPNMVINHFFFLMLSVSTSFQGTEWTAG